MKKVLIIGLTLVLALAMFAGCAGGEAPDVTESPSGPKLEGELGDILDNVNESGKIEMSVGNLELTAEMQERFTGLTDADFTALVDSATVSEAMINAIAHSSVLIKAKDSKAALSVQEKVFAAADALSGKWVCVRPEKLIVGVSGEYVYLVMSDSDTADNLYKAFEELAGNVKAPLSKNV